jgi:hypothetical protein
MSNKPLITSDFCRLQYIPEFIDNHRITDSDICIFVHICVHSFRGCFTRFGTFPNYIHIKVFVKTTCKCFSTKQQHRYGLKLWLANLMSNCWLEVSLHPEGPAAGQLDQGFLWFSLVLEQMLSWYPIPRFTACFTCSPPNGNIKILALI